jgi:hypothetical protein
VCVKGGGRLDWHWSEDLEGLVSPKEEFKLD